MKYYVGLDVSVKLTAICIVDEAGTVVRETVLATEPSKPGCKAVGAALAGSVRPESVDRGWHAKPWIGARRLRTKPLRRAGAPLSVRSGNRGRGSALLRQLRINRSMLGIKRSGARPPQLIAPFR